MFPGADRASIPALPIAARHSLARSLTIRGERLIRSFGRGEVVGAAPCDTDRGRMPGSNYAAPTYALSPDGNHGACLKRQRPSSDYDDRDLVLFSITSKGMIQRVLFRGVSHNGDHSLTFIDDEHVAALIRDPQCPGGHYSEWNTRVIVFDLSGERHLLSCSLAIVAGTHRTAYMRYVDYAWEFSVDSGKHWQLGRPQAFTDNDDLLYIDGPERLRDLEGDIISDNVDYATWLPGK